MRPGNGRLSKSSSDITTVATVGRLERLREVPVRDLLAAHRAAADHRDAAPVRGVHLVEVDVLLLGRGVHLHRHVDEPERERALPHRAHRDLRPTTQPGSHVNLKEPGWPHAPHARHPRNPPGLGRLAYQLKWDGIRLVTAAESGRLALASRNGVDHTGRWPRARRARRTAAGRPHGARRRARGLRRRRPALLREADVVAGRCAGSSHALPVRRRGARRRRPVGTAVAAAARAAGVAAAERVALAHPRGVRRRRGAAVRHGERWSRGRRRQAPAVPVPAGVAAPTG